MARFKEKVTVSIDPSRLSWLDGLVQGGSVESRSAGFEAAIDAFYEKREDEQLERALAAVTPEDVEEQQALAEEGMDDFWEIAKENTW